MPAALLAVCWVLLEIGTRAAARLSGRRLQGSALLLSGAVCGISVFLAILIGLGLAGSIAGSIAGSTLWGALGIALAGALVVEPHWHLRSAARRGVALAFPRSKAGLPAALLLWTGVVLTLILDWRDTASGLTFDSLYYHLPFTADVVHTGGIPLGDDAQAHQPKNHGLLSAGLWVLTGSETVAVRGNALWLPLGTLALYVAARALRCRRRAALAGTLVPFFAPEWVAQASGAMADLPFAIAWFTFAALCLLGVRRRDADLALPAGLALGLAVGCKSLALPFAPLALAFAAALLVRSPRSALHFGAGVLATGAFFYLRNLALTGNPLFPIEVRALGSVVFPGDYGNEVMSDWIFAQRGRTDQPFWLSFVVLFLPLTGAVRQGVIAWLGDLDAIGYAHFVVPGLVLLLGALVRVRQVMVLVCALAAPAVVAICWFVLPYTYGRFALLAVPFVAVLASCLASAWRGFGLVALAGVALLLIDGNGMPMRLAIAAGVGAGVLGLTSFVARTRVARVMSMRSVLATCALAMLVSWTRWAPVGAEDAAPMAPFRAALAHCKGNVAVAGTELRYGFQLGRGNHAARVPLDGRIEVPYHLRSLAWRRDGLPRPRTPEARLQDRFADPQAWLATLQRDFDTLVVARLHDQALLAHRHDAEGFPEELAWAAAAAPVLTEVHRDAEVRVFAIDRAAKPVQALPAPRERREPEALALLPDSTALARWYPLAPAELTKPCYARALLRIRSTQPGK